VEPVSLRALLNSLRQSLAAVHARASLVRLVPERSVEPARAEKEAALLFLALTDFALDVAVARLTHAGLTGGGGR
jgi:hypothetical protein